MRYYHESVFMPDFDFACFWDNIQTLTLSGHASMRQHMRVFPLISISKIRSVGRVYEVCMDDFGISSVCVRVPLNEGRDLYYVISREGVIITGWWRPSWHSIPRPSSKRNYKTNYKGV